MQLSSENQIQRLNKIINEVEQISHIAPDLLNTKLEKDKWNAIEVIEHLNLAYDTYRPQIEATLPVLENIATQEDRFAARVIPSMLINMIKPKGQERNWKMKTFQIFTPDFSVEATPQALINKVFGRFFEQANHLKAAIKESRYKNVRQQKVVTALGPMVKFYLPECYEFMIAHIERHLVQINQTLKAIGDAKTAAA